MNENLDKEIDGIVAPIPSKNETRLTIAVVVLGVIIIAIIAFGVGYYWSSGQSQEQQNFAVPTSNQTSNQTLTAPTKDLKIKGNKKSKIYHLPGCGSYDRISPDNIEWFKTKEDAEAAGYRIAKNC